MTHDQDERRECSLAAQQLLRVGGGMCLGGHYTRRPIIRVTSAAHWRAACASKVG